MFDRIRTDSLRFLRVPPDPAPPAGAPGSLRVFRGGRNLYKLRLFAWLTGQIGAVIGIAFSLYFLGRLESAHEEAKRIAATAPSAAKSPAAKSPGTAAPSAAPATPTAAPPAPAASAPATATASTPSASPAATPTAPAADAAAAAATPADASAAPAAAPAASEAAPKKSKSKLSPEARARARGGLARMVERWPWWIFPLLRLLEWGGIALFVLQIPVTYALVRLDYELRWYLVTDRSLRIRTGLTTVQEATMSFANLQQVVVTQGPLQRLLGLADVRVQSAGGGGDSHEQKGGDSLHTGVFHGVDNASEVRDLILERLRVFRETGLGDPDEPAAAPPPLAPAPAGSAAPAPASAATLAAARELLAEARALRAAVS
jgi:hypothetical protein